MGASGRGDQPGGGLTAPPLTELLPVPGFLPRHIWGKLVRLEAPKSQGCLGSTLPGGWVGPPCRAGGQRGKGLPADPGELVSLSYREREERRIPGSGRAGVIARLGSSNELKVLWAVPCLQRSPKPV